jgi:hypothetical protein
MNTPSRPASLLLGLSLALGISADVLLRAFPPGINAALWLFSLIAALTFLAHRLDHSLVGGWKIVAASGGLCALGLSWRDSSVLFLFNVAGALGGCVLIATRTSSRGLRESTFFELFHGMLVHIVHATAGAGFLIAREVFSGDRGERRGKRTFPSLLRGLAITVPFLLLFGSLLAAADASFEHIVGRLFDFDLSSLFVHIVLAGSVAWAVAGFLRGSLLAEEVPAPLTLRESFLSLGIIEVGVLLGFLDALFLLFVVLQIPYLFGGGTTVATTTALTYADYARRGFFELTAVACLTITTLLIADWILRKDSRRDTVLFRFLAGFTLLLLGAIMASAWQRLLLYQEAYGLTEARLYAAAALTGMGLVTVWFALSVLAGRRTRFAFGSLIAAYAVVLALDVINPDALIARIDLRRKAEGKAFDARYLATLSTDATPELIAGIPFLPTDDGTLISRELLRRNEGRDAEDWRTWNLSRARASEAIHEHLDSLLTPGSSPGTGNSQALHPPTQ